MSNIFEGDSDSDVEFRTNNEFAKNYNIRRKKEEINEPSTLIHSTAPLDPRTILHLRNISLVKNESIDGPLQSPTKKTRKSRIKTKYGDDIHLDEDSSSSSSDDEDGVELTEEIERDFFKTLACLKNKDPKIYDEEVNFFRGSSEINTTSVDKKKKKKDTPVYLKDYERKLILEKGGILSDEEDTLDKSTTHVQEQEHIKQSLKNLLNSDDDDDDDNGWDGLCKERKKTREEKEEEESGYKKWLAGEKDKIDDEEEKELKPLKDYWCNPKLDEGEKFLRDYILSKKFLEKDEDDYIPTYDEIIHDSDQDLSNDEDTLEKQEEFEYKYNFRFEEPDPDFIKRYPRTMENSLRKKDDKRKLKRQEVKERKKMEKEEKIKELRKLQELKRIEIEEKLEKLKEITGNSNIEFKNDDIDGDFDPEEHDKRMQALFDDDYYQGPEEEQKPVFPEIDQELEIENWDRYENDDKIEFVPHCEDDDFNMDCDYDPNASIQNELIEMSKGKKKRKRKSKVAEALSKPKPKFDPSDKNYEKYFDEYYKLDCEDVIGDIPCRFKYRSVVPNDFGLSTEEILFAKERELNKWCSLKKAVQIRPDHVEQYDQIAYKKKAQNMNLKKKILPSLFTPDSEDLEATEKSNVGGITSKQEANDLSKEESNGNNRQHIENNGSDCKKKNKNKKNNRKGIKKDDMNQSNVVENQEQGIQTTIEKTKEGKSKKDVKEKLESTHNLKQNQNRQSKRKSSMSETEVPRKKIKKNKKQNQNKKELSISDARLSAYGINPKKYKNKLKFGSK